jgi:hypothetical protein
LLEEKISKIEESSGVAVFIPTCAEDIKATKNKKISVGKYFNFKFVI